MAERDVFSSRGWNFVGGDRQIEAILRELPPRTPIVVRNRLANVLATVAGLVDLQQLGAAALAIHVPENALVEPGLGFDTLLAVSDWPSCLLSRLYHVETVGSAERASVDDLLVATGFTEAHEAEATALAAWLAPQPELAVVLLVPRGQTLAPALREVATTAWSTQHWGGLNAFSLAGVEEAVLERTPARIYVASPDPLARLYTAVGAADAYWREPGETARGAGARVRALDLLPQPPTLPDQPVRALVLAHLAALGATSTAADARFAVTGEAIAIDLL